MVTMPLNPSPGLNGPFPKEPLTLNKNDVNVSQTNQYYRKIKTPDSVAVNTTWKWKTTFWNIESTRFFLKT